MKFKILVVFAALLMCNISFAQEKKTEMEKVAKLRTKKKVKVADNLYNKGSYYNAIEVYEMVLVKKPSHTATEYKLGVTNYAIRDYAKSAEWFQKVASFDSIGYPLSQYFLASSLKRLGKYDEAKVVFGNFKKTIFKKETADVTALKKTVDNEVNGCDYALKSMAEKTKVKIRHVAEINNPMSDYAPRQYKDKLIFSALKADSVIVIDPNNPDPKRFSRLNESAQAAGDTWSAPSNFNAAFNAGEHVGNGMYSNDGKSFVFTKCSESPELKMICKIFLSSYSGGAWSTPVLLGNGINTENSTSTHPFFATNEQGNDVLYFASDMNGGKGGMDIYYSLKGKNNDFGAPKNAGSVINTAGNEVTPFLDAKNKKLYFSSDALVNMGGFDIYSSTIVNNDFTAPTNIGFPLNSSVDDLYFANGETDKKGFLVSNRPGGMALKSPTCCDDILAFNYPAEFVNVQGKVTDELTGEPVKDCFMYVYNTKNDSLIGQFPIAADGTFNFKLKADEQYKMVNSCKQYKDQETLIDTRNMEDGQVITKDIKLKKKDFYDGMSLGIVYYDYNKAKLRDESRPTLDTVFNLLMTRDDFVVRVEGHTDQRGTDEYNQPLSEKRAEAVYNYLVKKGVPTFKLLQAGFGESRPVENCMGKAGCTETGLPDCDCHQNNRRTEFVLFQEVSKIK